MKSKEIIETAGNLVSGPRAGTHGEKLPNHQNIADLWNAYLGLQPDQRKLDRQITALDAALMMALLKVARTKLGSHNVDNYVDLAGYAGVAGEIAELIHGTPPHA